MEYGVLEECSRGFATIGEERNDISQYLQLKLHSRQIDKADPKKRRDFVSLADPTEKGSEIRMPKPGKSHLATLTIADVPVLLSS